MTKGTRKVKLTRWYANDTIEVTEHPSRAAAERTVEAYRADAVFPYIRTYAIEPRQD